MNCVNALLRQFYTESGCQGGLKQEALTFNVFKTMAERRLKPHPNLSTWQEEVGEPATELLI
ncbi:hypothetical protein DA391_04000 [Yersinia massiliensis]|uniref:Uncharacterized protein n=1 Tax=Yersinia massiliensis TaxID=419257 RepID=A0ABM6UPP4_9GAMM|nr:hypothetical protein CRN74_15195 [Yersinia frederiksenii]AVX36895.1 hypothetical protein DA391_04000 [Yersinia massiliensis]